MANSKIIFNGKTLIDLTSDTVAADKLLVPARLMPIPRTRPPPRPKS